MVWQDHPSLTHVCNLHYPYKYFTACTTILFIFMMSLKVAIRASRELQDTLGVQSKTHHRNTQTIPIDVKSILHLIFFLAREVWKADTLANTMFITHSKISVLYQNLLALVSHSGPWWPSAYIYSKLSANEAPYWLNTPVTRSSTADKAGFQDAGPQGLKGDTPDTSFRS